MTQDGTRHGGGTARLQTAAMARFLRAKLTSADPALPLHLLQERQQPFLSIEQIKNLILDPEAEVISFDIFDTLLMRPVLNPGHIFSLLDKKIKALYGIDFLGIRSAAEIRLGKKNARIEEIYQFMAAEQGWTGELAQKLMEEEIECEKRLSSVRDDMQQLYTVAKASGKRIIAVSDMYLGEHTIKNILSAHDLHFDKIYVSCDYDARKDDGSLYEKVLLAEGVEPCKIVHIGDNWASDYRQALEKKLVAVWVPSVRDRILGGAEIYDFLFKDILKGDTLWSLYLGFALNKLYNGPASEPINILDLSSLQQFATLLLAPLLTAFALYLRYDKELQEKYNNIYFASRDGWIPSHVHEAVREVLGGRPATYFAAGRRAYYSLLATDFFSYAQSCSATNHHDGYSLHDFLKAFFAGQPLLDFLEEKLSDEEKALDFIHDRERALQALEPFKTAINQTFAEHRQHARAYYQRVFAGDPHRAAVFDIGYSGSLGTALSAALERPIRKEYFWQTERNRENDKLAGTATHTFFNNALPHPYPILLEDLLSPAEGGISGWAPDGSPVKEAISPTEDFVRDAGIVLNTCVEYAREFCTLLGPYAEYAQIRQRDSIFDLYSRFFNEAPYPNLGLFRNFCLPDPLCSSVPNSTQKRLEWGLSWKNTLQGTGFDAPDAAILPRPRILRDHMAGVHVHLYNREQAQEFLRYLQHLPLQFDLYVTITDAAYKPTLEKLFSRHFLPRLERSEVIAVPNRGRDVAPWILALASQQSQYEFFCHVHSKASPGIPHGDAWRKYLLDNLLDTHAVKTIINIFEDDPDMGLLFPAPFPAVRDTFINLNVPAYGSEKEYQMICGLLQRMQMRPEVCRPEFFFSMGTMMWYRPQALRQLFTLGIQLEEFPEEPIGPGGTLAHALERLPAIVARRNGFGVKSITPFPARESNVRGCACG